MGTLVAAWIERDVVACSGPDAATFLQGQLSQDVVGIAVGASRWSLVLQPQGKVESFVRVSRVAEAEFLLDVEAGHGAAMLTRLQRFKLRVDCQFETVDGWRCLAIRALDDDGGAALDSLDTSSAAIVAPVDWPLTPGVDLLGPAVEVPSGVALDGGPKRAFERLRIRAGIPRLGAELDESTIPAEAGQWLIDHSVSFTKGCFVGQELVARVDSRGSNTPRKLRLLRIAHGVTTVGAEVMAGGEVVGAVTSVANLDALAFLRRSVEVGDAVTVGGEPATVEALPAG